MRSRIWLAGLLACLTLLSALPAAPARAQAGERCFPATGQCISGAIRAFWEQNGGLPVFGLPLGPQQPVAGEDGQRRETQWFERARLELHPELAAPYTVQLGRLGADRLAQQGRDWRSFPRAAPEDADAERCRLFPETGQQVCDQFLRAFRASGLSFPGVAGVTYEESLALFGLPLSGPLTETIEGKEYTVQWFERARFELHPENQPPSDVLFGRLGAELGPGPGPAQPAVEGAEWVLISFGAADAPTPAVATEQPATLRFEGGQVSGFSGCNGFGGSYTAGPATISFGPIVGTLRACSEAIGRQEGAIYEALQGEAPYSVADGRLRISYAGGAQALTYGRGAQRAVVSGTITYRQRSALPAEAQIEVKLVDISRADAPAVEIAGASFAAGGRQVPIPFALAYDPARIDERLSYAVQARITLDGRLIFTSDTVYPVITRGNPSSVEIVVVPVS